MTIEQKKTMIEWGKEYNIFKNIFHKKVPMQKKRLFSLYC